MARRLSAVTFVLLLCAGLAVVLARLISAAPGLAQQVRMASWTDGSVTALLGARVDRAAPDSPALDQAMHGLLYAATGDADPQVRQGCAGWLFLAEETASTPHGEQQLRQRVRLASLLRADLARRGITLLLLPVPDKVEQAHAELCGLAVSDQARGRRQAWLAASANRGWLQTDLSTGWPGPAYWRTDSHWDRTGAAFAAARVAALARAVLPRGATAMQRTTAPQASVRNGDLARLAGLADNRPPFAPAAEYDHASTLTITRGGGLLDDVAAPQVLLAGSSYSLNSGFLDALQLQLGQEVSQQSYTGSGYAGSLLDVMTHPQRLNGVRLLIWEWPLRSLYQPLTGAETDYLKRQGHQP